MSTISSSWNHYLKELNDVNCKIEFLQSKMRDIIVKRKGFDIEEYLVALENIITEHTYNLYSLADKKDRDVFIVPDFTLNKNLAGN